jgi:hypothetical protein
MRELANLKSLCKYGKLCRVSHSSTGTTVTNKKISTLRLGKISVDNGVHYRIQLSEETAVGEYPEKAVSVIENLLNEILNERRLKIE